MRSLEPQENISHLVEEETSESECEVQPRYRWRIEHDDSRDYVSERNHESVLPVGVTVDDLERVSEQLESDEKPYQRLRMSLQMSVMVRSILLMMQKHLLNKEVILYLRVIHQC